MSSGAYIAGSDALEDRDSVQWCLDQLCDATNDDVCRVKDILPGRSLGKDHCAVGSTLRCHRGNEVLGAEDVLVIHTHATRIIGELVPPAGFSAQFESRGQTWESTREKEGPRTGVAW
jgi:hypothetical protein